MRSTPRRSPLKVKARYALYALAPNARPMLHVWILSTLALLSRRGMRYVYAIDALYGSWLTLTRSVCMTLSMMATSTQERSLSIHADTHRMAVENNPFLHGFPTFRRHLFLRNLRVPHGEQKRCELCIEDKRWKSCSSRTTIIGVLKYRNSKLNPTRNW